MPIWSSGQHIPTQKIPECPLPDFRPLEVNSSLYTRPGAGGGGYSHTFPIRVCAAQQGHDFEAGYQFQRHFLDIIFRTNEGSSFVSSHLKLLKDRLLLKIQFNVLTSKLLYSLHPRTEYKKIGPCLERGINFRANSRMGYQF